MSIEEISLGVGYENQSYFFRQFKKRYGMIPRRYRIEKGQKVCKLLKNSERVGMLFTLQEIIEIILKSVLLQNSSDRNYIEYVERGWSLLGKR